MYIAKASRSYLTRFWEGFIIGPEHEGGGERVARDVLNLATYRNQAPGGCQYGVLRCGELRRQVLSLLKLARREL